MANHCFNNIIITGNKKEIASFFKHLQFPEENKSINIYPRLLKTFKNGEIGNDARWFDIDFIEADDNEIILSGDSAWSPCLQLFTKISNLYKSFKIHYEYEEQGSDFCGFADMHKGMLKDNCFSYWLGKVTMNRSEALESVLSGYLDDFDTQAELLESDLFNSFPDDDKRKIFEEWNEQKHKQEAV